jgi:hypothetical protein
MAFIACLHNAGIEVTRSLSPFSLPYHNGASLEVPVRTLLSGLLP